MAFGTLNTLIILSNLQNAIAARGRREAAKLPPAADFAGLFTEA
jgi:hypothetical protein